MSTLTVKREMSSQLFGYFQSSPKGYLFTTLHYLFAKMNHFTCNLSPVSTYTVLLETYVHTISLISLPHSGNFQPAF